MGVLRGRLVTVPALQRQQRNRGTRARRGKDIAIEQSDYSDNGLWNGPPLF